MAFPYWRLVKESLSLALVKRRLWWVALFATEVSIFIGMDYGKIDQMFRTGAAMTYVSLFWRAGWYSAGIMTVFVLAVAVAVFAIICKAGLIAGIKAAVKNQPAAFAALVKTGAGRFYPMLVIELLLFLPTFALFGGFALNSRLNGPAAVMWLSIGLIFLYNLVIFFFRYYIYCGAVLENLRAGAAIRAGFQLFMKNFRVTLIIGLIRMVMIIVFALAMILSFLLMSIPFALLFFLLALVLPWYVGFIVSLLGLLTGAAAVLIIMMYQSTCLYSLMIKTYWQLK